MKSLLTIAVLLSTIAIACSKATNNTTESSAPFAAEEKALAISNPNLPQADTASKQVIKTADVVYEVTDKPAYYRHIQQLLVQHNGYISKEENINSEYQDKTVCIIKVPVNNFDAMLNALPVADVTQIEKAINTEDVTIQLVDAHSRLVAKKAVRDKYLTFLTNAKSMEDMLRIQKEIDVIQEDIESVESILLHLSNQVAYSTIHLSFYKRINEPVGNGFGGKMLAALKTGTDIFVGLFLGILTIWPLMLIAAIVIYFYRKRTLNINVKKIA